MSYDQHVPVETMLGLTMKEVTINKERNAMRFKTIDGQEFLLHHEQDCCESVNIDDVNGDLSDLVGLPLSMCEEVVNKPDLGKKDGYDDSHTWTFYKFATPKGYVNVKWYGSSNGYYSESVHLAKII